MKQPTEAISCIEIVEPFVRAMYDEGITNVQIMGGVGSVALAQPETEIFVDERMVVVPETDKLRNEIGQFRPNGTLRDLDCLVMSDDEQEVTRAEDLATSIIGEQLDLSAFFQLHNVNELDRKMRLPILGLATMWVGDRYITSEDGKITGAQKVLYPFAVDLPEAALEPWHLHVGDRTPMPIPSPAVAPLNYMTRSISGLRPKDAEKVGNLIANLEEKAPELIDWMVDGPGKSQVELATVLHSLRESRKRPQPLRIGKTYTHDVFTDEEIINMDVFLGDQPEIVRRRAVAISRAKARPVYLGESNETVVKVWQKFVEGRIGGFLKNKA